jgi:hypothetical protein
MIDDVEAVRTRGPIDAANVDQDFKTTARIVSQERHDRDDLLARNVERQLVVGNRHRPDSCGMLPDGVFA